MRSLWTYIITWLVVIRIVDGNPWLSYLILKSLWENIRMLISHVPLMKSPNMTVLHLISWHDYGPCYYLRNPQRLILRKHAYITFLRMLSTGVSTTSWVISHMLVSYCNDLSMFRHDHYCDWTPCYLCDSFSEVHDNSTKVVCYLNSSSDPWECL